MDVCDQGRSDDPPPYESAEYACQTLGGRSGKRGPMRSNKNDGGLTKVIFYLVSLRLGHISRRAAAERGSVGSPEALELSRITPALASGARQ